MPQIKAQDVNWLEEAWSLSELLAQLPDWGAPWGAPKGSNLLLPRPPELTPSQLKRLRLLQDQIALHMTYRIRVVYKFRFSDDPNAIVHVNSRDPSLIAGMYIATNLEFQDSDNCAVLAQAYLARIVLDRFVNPEWKRKLPLMVAGIGGQTLSRVNRLNSARTRQPRTSRLQIAKRQAKVAHPGESFKELLQRLEGDGIVKSWDATEILWWDDDGTLKKTTIGTFNNWK